VKAPRSRPRNPKKHQAPNAKRRLKVIVWSLALGLSLVLGVWCFVLWRTPSPPLVPLTSIDPSLASIIETSRTAVIRTPKSAAAWGGLGQALHAAEFTSQARLCYSNALARDKTDFRWPYLLGLLELQEQPDTATAHFQRATELAAGKSEMPRFQLARALVELGRHEQAAPHLNLLLAANPNHAAAHMELARVHLARGALKEATHALQPALTNNYTKRSALLIGAQIAQRNNQPEVAAQLSRGAASLPRSFDWPDPVLREVQNMRVDKERLADQANALLQQQRPQEAEMVLARLLNSYPEDAESLLLLGRLRYVQGRCPEAEAAYRKHLAIQSNSLNGLIQLGLSLLCQQQWTNAAAVLEQAIALKPDFGQAHNNLAVARSRAGDAAGAVRAYRDALRCNPGDFNAHMGLAEGLANAGQLEEAKEHVERAAALNPNEPRVQKAREQLGMKR
jgi:tetratricopeptide (TPR) repeat protein